ncbi:hypothetical protein UY3_05672 [Chelonia mydas]|uniref:Uncharacterized protein n=1 Tax=Chelonia mydas TaxID=8469 RepID=M7BGU3_CHEMY|nr:hypothetical protein UY3_05672 [Chelonia mydas]
MGKCRMVHSDHGVNSVESGTPGLDSVVLVHQNQSVLDSEPCARSLMETPDVGIGMVRMQQNRKMCTDSVTVYTNQALYKDKRLSSIQEESQP